LVDAVSQDPILQRIFATIETFSVATLQETLHNVAESLPNVAIPALLLPISALKLPPVPSKAVAYGGCDEPQ
jgi:hypothetical protein